MKERSKSFSAYLKKRRTIREYSPDDFPIEIKEFTLVEDAHTAVARGCLSEAQLIEEEDGESEEKSA